MIYSEPNPGLLSLFLCEDIYPHLSSRTRKSSQNVECDNFGAPVSLDDAETGHALRATFI